MIILTTTLYTTPRLTNEKIFSLLSLYVGYKNSSLANEVKDTPEPTENISEPIA